MTSGRKVQTSSIFGAAYITGFLGPTICCHLESHFSPREIDNDNRDACSSNLHPSLILLDDHDIPYANRVIFLKIDKSFF